MTGRGRGRPRAAGVCEEGERRDSSQREEGVANDDKIGEEEESAAPRSTRGNNVRQWIRQGPGAAGVRRGAR
jgi:hypothetical protein